MASALMVLPPPWSHEFAAETAADPNHVVVGCLGAWGGLVGSGWLVVVTDPVEEGVDVVVVVGLGPPDPEGDERDGVVDDLVVGLPLKAGPAAGEEPEVAVGGGLDRPDGLGPGSTAVADVAASEPAEVEIERDVGPPFRLVVMVVVMASPGAAGQRGWARCQPNATPMVAARTPPTATQATWGILRRVTAVGLGVLGSQSGRGGHSRLGRHHGRL